MRYVILLALITLGLQNSAFAETRAQEVRRHEYRVQEKRREAREVRHEIAKKEMWQKHEAARGPVLHPVNHRPMVTMNRPPQNLPFHVGRLAGATPVAVNQPVNLPRPARYHEEQRRMEVAREAARAERHEMRR